jgi:uncharacterized protein (DUF433 family)
MTKFKFNNGSFLNQESVTHLPIEKVIWIDPKRMGGEPCFFNTRVPINTLWVHLEAGEPLEVFFEDFEGVSLEQVRGLIFYAAQNMNEKLSELLRGDK